MNNVLRTAVLSAAIVFPTVSQAAIVNFTITGTFTSPGFTAFDIEDGSVVTVEGMFNDDALAADGSGKVFFGLGDQPDNSFTFSINSGTPIALDQTNDYDHATPTGGINDPAYIDFLADGSFYEFSYFTQDPKGDGFLCTIENTGPACYAWDANGDTYTFNNGHLNYSVSPVPVPAAAGLFGLGLAGLSLLRRRKTSATTV